MTDQITAETLTANIRNAFLHLYPHLEVETIESHFHDDETITVEPDPESFPSLKAVIDSDDDGYLRFGIHDPDYEAEHPEENLTDFLMIRVKAF